MRRVWVSCLLIFCLVSSWTFGQGGYSREQWERAKEEAKIQARRGIGQLIYGYYAQYRAVLSLQEDRLLGEIHFVPYTLPLLHFHDFIGYKDLGLIRLSATIERVQLIEAIHADRLHQTGQGLSRQDYQDLRFMFPEEITVKSFGACTTHPHHPGRRYIQTLERYKVQAAMRLVSYLRGPTISAVSRLENFFLTQDTIEAILPQTLLKGALFCVSEPNKWHPDQITLTIMTSGSDWIFSILSALQRQGSSLSAEEYLKLRTRFARYPSAYITLRLPDDILIDPNSPYSTSSTPHLGGSLTQPPLGVNEFGDADVLWK
jgi:hypothetical protein